MLIVIHDNTMYDVEKAMRKILALSIHLNEDTRKNFLSLTRS